MLLYAKTEEEISPNLDAMFGQNHILVQTLDLNQVYHDIFRQLDNIAIEFTGKEYLKKQRLQVQGNQKCP